MVPGVQTGEDVVAFYGRNGQDSSVKFFYCVRWAAPVCWETSPGLHAELCTGRPHWHSPAGRSMLLAAVGSVPAG